MNTKKSFWLFAIAASANLTGHLLSNDSLANYSKVLLMPLLLFHLIEVSKGNVNKQVLLLGLALIFSWAGDLLLIKDEYFVFGIGAFLLAQITYIIVFLNSSNSRLQFRLIPAVPYILYTAFFFSLVLPNAGALKIPIIIYGITLMSMGYTSAIRKDKTSEGSFQFTMIGSSLFIISDSLIAFNMFYMEIPMRGLLVMSTYIAAQLLIVLGIAKHHIQSA